MDETILKELWGGIVLSELIGSYQRRDLILCDPSDRRLKICIYCENNHKRPHVHIYWTKEYEVSISISDREVLIGEIPRKNLKAIKEWIEKYEKEILHAWHTIQAGEKPELSWVKNA